MCVVFSVFFRWSRRFKYELNIQFYQIGCFLPIEMLFMLVINVVIIHKAYNVMEIYLNWLVLAIFHFVWRLYSHLPGLDKRSDFYRIAGLAIIIIAICILAFKSIFEFSSVLKSNQKNAICIRVSASMRLQYTRTHNLVTSTRNINFSFSSGRIWSYCLNGKFQISMNETQATTTVNGLFLSIFHWKWMEVCNICVALSLIMYQQ